MYSAADDAALRLDALVRWVAAFEATHGRAPSIWLASLCADPALSALEQLEQLPVYMARSRRLLVLVGPNLPASLWPDVEIYAWHVLGCGPDSIDVALAASDGDVDVVAAAFDLFHVMYTPAEEAGADVHRRLLRAAELAGVPRFNFVVRELVHALDKGRCPFRDGGGGTVMRGANHAMLV